VDRGATWPTPGQDDDLRLGAGRSRWSPPGQHHPRRSVACSGGRSRQLLPDPRLARLRRESLAGGPASPAAKQADHIREISAQPTTAAPELGRDTAARALRLTSRTRPSVDENASDPVRASLPASQAACASVDHNCFGRPHPERPRHINKNPRPGVQPWAGQLVRRTSRTGSLPGFFRVVNVSSPENPALCERKTTIFPQT
jgi:hypothetical protein